MHNYISAGAVQLS